MRTPGGAGPPRSIPALDLGPRAALGLPLPLPPPQPTTPAHFPPRSLSCARPGSLHAGRRHSARTQRPRSRPGSGCERRRARRDARGSPGRCGIRPSRTRTSRSARPARCVTSAASNEQGDFALPRPSAGQGNQSSFRRDRTLQVPKEERGVGRSWQCRSIILC